MKSEIPPEKTKDNVESTFPLEYPKYIRDAEQIAADVTVWTWNKVDEEGMLPLREQANELAELFERQKKEHENVESDAHVRLGVKTAELERQYQEAARRHSEQVLQNMEYLKTRVGKFVDREKAEMSQEISRQQKIQPGSSLYNPEMKEICSLLQQTGFESAAMIHDFMQRMAERSKGKEISLPEINVWLHRLADTLRKILFGHNTMRTLTLYQRQYEARLARKGQWSGIELVEMEKRYANLRDACFDRLQLLDARFEMALKNPLAPDDQHRAEQMLAVWLANARNGEEIRYLHEFITDVAVVELRKQKGGQDYNDRVVITAKKVAENEYTLFASEWLSVRAYVAGQQLKILPLLRALEQETRTGTDNAKTQLTVPKQHDTAMESNWMNYRHVDANYRQAQISISNLDRERITAIIQKLLREIAQDDERPAAPSESVK